MIYLFFQMIIKYVLKMHKNVFKGVNYFTPKNS